MRERGDQFIDLAGTMRRDEAGATMIEYGIIMGLVSIAIIAALLSIQGMVGNDVFTVVANALSNF
jgi:pilus assembly protein Flp/PilA